MLKKTISTHALALLLLGGGIAFSQASCNRAERQEAANETAAATNDAYNDFKTFVANTEARADSMGDITEAEYNEESTQLKSDYDSKVAAAEADMATWDDARKTEYEQLKTRYNTAYTRREETYRNRGAVAMNTTTGGSSASGSSSMNATSGAGAMGKYYKPSNLAGSLTAANARQTYENFIQMVKQNEDRYDINDWRNINAEWRALDQKYEQIKGDVSTGDKAEIAKEKLKYAAFKSYDKAETRVSQGADLATGKREEAAAKGSGVRLEQSARNAGSDAKEVGKDAAETGKNVGQKVGGAVKGAYKEVKSEVKNTDND
ncbi:DUF6565 domain-containing protein [Hymenobacter latericus]|uniref:DUF6565 domain-containing protein n=1 Tax=Hymenobacter sp. YIM 151858-1 TaxID=2987688 RepID=UPI002227D879|nr:DUF6565 domain-containing protein [Hymenobacter sp. YIM 151858-1]UYZ60597.1 hypothetical protein OIS50_07305 [Hymenobacter sp. YIM 151858-1]